MAEFRKRFWQPVQKMKVGEIASIIKAEVVGNQELLIERMKPLKSAASGDLTFLSNPKYNKQLRKSKASACIIKEIDLPLIPEGMTAIIVNNPYFAWAQILELFFPKITINSNISDKAFVSPTAKIGSGSFIGAGAIIEDEAEIGSNCHIYPGAYIGKKVIIGTNVNIGHAVTIEYSKIGDNCTIHAGARIGQDGFGFTNDNTRIIKIKQIGAVIIGNNVEIGANSCIDRGAIEDTVIGDNTKIDNLVQIAHNVKIGQNCFLAGQVGIAGSTVIGNGVMLGGQVGIIGHIELKDGVIASGASVITRNLEKGKVVGGYPAVDINQWHRQTILLKKMVETAKSSLNPKKNNN
ncbi:MAG: UDP-3-O-(3-hydroxymyristoyl)glucosamine N-acyltransferase [Candidatus Midichloria sp.]|nr:MAG: UDP-3-O-(3-hydroxymyristoyl)glucosamine N-acyltransferase [Candidatus Midichloria sp.]